MFQTVTQNESRNTQSVHNTGQCGTVLSAEQSDRHTVTAI